MEVQLREPAVVAWVHVVLLSVVGMTAAGAARAVMIIIIDCEQQKHKRHGRQRGGEGGGAGGVRQLRRERRADGLVVERRAAVVDRHLPPLARLERVAVALVGKLAHAEAAPQQRALGFWGVCARVCVEMFGWRKKPSNRTAINNNTNNKNQTKQTPARGTAQR